MVHGCCDAGLKPWPWPVCPSDCLVTQSHRGPWPAPRRVWPSEGSHAAFAPRGWKQRALAAFAEAELEQHCEVEHVSAAAPCPPARTSQGIYRGGASRLPACASQLQEARPRTQGYTSSSPWLR